MAKYPTKKSRRFAWSGIILVVMGLVLDAWFSPPLPRISTPISGFVTLALMQLAKQTREADGAIIPEAVVKEGAAIANAEALLSILCAFGVFTCIGIELAGSPKQYARVATIVTLCCFGVTAAVLRFTRARYDALMRAAGVDPARR